MEAVARLEEGQDLLLIAPFEPAPLYGVLGQQGFQHQSKDLESGDWEVRFCRGSEEPVADTAAASPSPRRAPCAGPPVIDVDARGLEPPQPLVKILEAVVALPAGARLRAHTDRRPMHLYSRLEERALKWETIEQADGSFITDVG
jgi:uncharacterized protein (DUF2249 family)